MYHSYVNVYREPPVLLIPKLERWGQWPKQMTATKEAWASRLHTDLRILRGVPQPEIEHLLNHVESIESAQQDGNYILFWAQPVFGFVWAPKKIKNLKHIPDGFPKWCGWTNGKMINSSTQHIQAHVQMIYLLNPIISHGHFPIFPYFSTEARLATEACQRVENLLAPISKGALVFWWPVAVSENDELTDQNGHQRGSEWQQIVTN